MRFSDLRKQLEIYILDTPIPLKVPFPTRSPETSHQPLVNAATQTFPPLKSSLPSLPCLAHLFSLLSRSLTGAKINSPHVSRQSSFSCVARASAHTHVFRVSPYTRNSVSGYFPKHSFGFFFPKKNSGPIYY